MTDRARHARTLFAGIAPEYEWMGAVLSFGQDSDIESWKPQSRLRKQRAENSACVRSVLVELEKVAAGVGVAEAPSI